MYGDLIENFGDLTEDNNLVEFFKAVLDRRDTLDEEERLCDDIPGVKDTSGASSTLGIPGWRNIFLRLTYIIYMCIEAHPHIFISQYFFCLKVVSLLENS